MQIRCCYSNGINVFVKIRRAVSSVQCLLPDDLKEVNQEGLCGIAFVQPVYGLRVKKSHKHQVRH